MNTKHFMTGLMAVFAMGWTAQAATLDPGAALGRVFAGKELPANTLSTDNNAYSLAMTVKDGGQPSVYVFAQDNTAGQGYLVVAADDVAPALLGYSTDGKVQSMPPALKYWLSEYGRQIEWARNNGAPVAVTQNRATQEFAPIAPLTTTVWNQDAPFNDDCPEINGEHCVTGCVATALSQVMKYHNWPPKGTGTHSYTPPSVGTTVSFDYGNTTFRWDDMINDYNGTATDAQKEAVATLMFACGVAVNMDYTVTESGSMSIDAAKAMITYFDYDKGITYLQRDYYGIDEWNATVYNQLKNYGPVQYSGQSNDGGHSWVCDGYSQDGYFHINWGWGGMSNGYFLLTALNPLTQGIGGSTSGYNFAQDIIANVKKADSTSPATAVPNFVADSFVASSTQQESSVSLGSDMLAYGPFYSFSLENVSGNYGIKAVDSNGNVTYYKGTAFNNVATQYGNYSYNVTLPGNLAEDTYTITPAVCDTQGNWYDVPVQVGAEKTTTMNVADGVATFTTESAASLSVSNVDLLTDFYIGSKFEVTADITNTGQQEYMGQILMLLINSSNSPVAQGSLYPVDLQPGQESSISYVSTFTATSGNTLTAGTYNVCFVNSSGQQLSPMQSITLNAAATPTLTVSNFTMPAGTANVDKNNLEFNADINCTAGYFGDALTVVIFPYTSGSVSSVASFTSDPVFVSSGNTAKMTAKGDFANGVGGNQYFAMLYNGQNPVSNSQLRFTLAKTDTSVDDLTDNDSAPVATAIFTLGGTPVANTANPVPGIYLVRTTHADGSVTVSKKVIK